MRQLIQNLMERGCLKTPGIIAAFQAIDRIDFVPAAEKEYAYENRPLPIGFGQTISQPEAVAFMLELLAPEKGDFILDVGSGSGWQTALLAQIAGDTGKVLAVEIITELYAMGKRNCEKYHFKNIEFILGNAAHIRKPDGYFDRIIAGASSAHEVPQSFKKQLKIGGRMVVPVRESIFVFTKKGADEFSVKEFPGFLFVPFVQD